MLRLKAEGSKLRAKKEIVLYYIFNLHASGIQPGDRP
jgi:hypothetical protein